VTDEQQLAFAIRLSAPLGGRRPRHLGQPLHDAPRPPLRRTQRRVLHRTTVSDWANTLEQEGLVAISAA
jgi:hypothetical protein